MSSLLDESFFVKNELYGTATLMRARTSLTEIDSTLLAFDMFVLKRRQVNKLSIQWMVDFKIFKTVAYLLSR